MTEEDAVVIGTTIRRLLQCDGLVVIACREAETEVLTFLPEGTVEQAVAALRRVADELETLVAAAEHLAVH